MDEIEILIHDRNIDILCISETWLLSNIPDSFVNIANFNIFRCDQGRGGGTCVYVRNDLKITPVNVNIPRIEGIENVWLNVQCRKLPSVIIGSIYRHPKAPHNTFDYILDVLRLICLRNKPIFILGDLNDDLFSSNNKLSQIIKNTKLCQIIDKPTRVTPMSATLLDVIITNKPDIVIHSDVTPCGIADHDLVSVIVDITKPKRQPEIRTLRNLKDYNKDMFCNKILNEVPSLNTILQTDDVNKQVEVFNDVFIKCLNECAPVVTKEVRRPYAPWIGEDITLAMGIRNDLQKSLKKDRYNTLLQEQYKQEKKRVKSLIQNAKSNYFREQIHKCKGNSGDTWKVVRQIIPNRSNSKQNDYDDVLNKAEEFNTFFASVGRKTYEKAQEMLFSDNPMVDEQATLYLDTGTNHLFRPQPVTIDTVILMVKQLKNSNSFGSDGIPTRFLKDSLFMIAFYITIIVNTSIVTGIYPSIWKYSHVIPQLKKGDIDDANNFRPVSLLPVLSKILERIVANQLTEHLESNSLLSNTQHGFRKKLSTETALMKVTEEIYKNMDNKKLSLLTLCDLSKAFDSVSHDILIRKCSELYIDSFWFEDYLTGRTQSVRIDKTISSVTNVNYGVPQGSILGPILFLIYVNDMSKIIHDCLFIQYADDAQFIHTDNIENLNELIKKAEDTLSKAKSYFYKNGLMLNAKKTQCIFIGSHHYIKLIPENTRINIGTESITPSSNVKNLGVYMDSHLLFNVHIDELCTKVTGILMFINRMKDKFDTNTRTQVVQSLALSTINYCSKIWGMTNKRQIQRVQKLQNFSAKVAVGGISKYDHATPVINKLQWLKIEEKCIYDICITVFKILQQTFPEWLITVQTVNQVRSVITRQRNDLFVNRTRTDMGSRSFKVKGPLLWNKLPSHVKDTLSLSVFKIRLKKYLLTMQ